MKKSGIAAEKSTSRRFCGHSRGKLLQGNRYDVLVKALSYLKLAHWQRTVHVWKTTIFRKQSFEATEMRILRFTTIQESGIKYAHKRSGDDLNFKE